jgi:hypothetical protein
MLLVCALAASARSIPDTNGKYSLVLTIGLGGSTYVKETDFPAAGVTSISENSVQGTVRLMWQPDHRLSLGLESGYVRFYRYSIDSDTSSGGVTLTAIPILITWGMPLAKRIKLFAGFGTYAMKTDLQGEKGVSSNTLSLGWALAAAYNWPLTKKVDLSAELKWMSAAETRDAILGLQVQLIWHFPI